MPQLTDELLQEKRSRTAFTERVERLKWIVDPVATDIGEDLLVRAMNGRRFSGITFFVQLKSRAEIPARDRRSTNYSQKIDVAHLKHWEGSAVPVVIVVWDVVAAEGYWISVNQVLLELTKNAPRFRSQKSIQVKIPFSNATTDVALRRLRKELAILCLPAVQRGRSISFSMQFRFPNSPTGRRQRRALDEAHSLGKGARISGKFIKTFKFTGWSARLFGPQDRPGEIQVGPMKPQVAPIALRLESLTSTGAIDAVVPYVELTVKRGGSAQVVLSNDDQGGTFSLQMTVPRAMPGMVKVQYSIRRAPTTVAELYTALRFGESISKGRTLRVIELRGGKASDYATTPGLGNTPQLVDLVKKLVTIQSRLERFGTILLRHGPRFSRDDEVEIDRLHSIVTTGRYASTGRIGLSMRRDAVKELIRMAEEHKRTGASAEDFEMLTTSQEPLDVFNIVVPITEVRRRFTCKLNNERLSELGEALKTEEGPSIRVSLRMNVGEQFPDFEAGGGLSVSTPTRTTIEQ
ncbi:MAG TPA: DUF4365 domain-containing protein [Kofleriaceae bacterium]|nr:DUF4365 domain-containing protein [Kofleriaceae bacterium]